MAFTPKDWKDSPDTSTPLEAAALEDLETRLSDYSDEVSGSSFNHLIEDTEDTATLSTDLGLHVSANMNDPYASSYVEILHESIQIATSSGSTAPTILVGREDEYDSQRFSVWGDGSLHWGDGEVPPDVVLFHVEDPFPDSSSADLGLAGQLLIGNSQAEINSNYSGEGSYDNVLSINGSGFFSSNDDNSHQFGLSYQYLHIQDATDRVLHMYIDVDGDPNINGQKIAFI